MKLPKHELGKTTMKYSLVFAVMALGIFAFFILADKSFIQYGDGYRQGYFAIVELRHQLEALSNGEGLSSWSWSRGLGAEVRLVTDPFYLIAALFPVGSIELGYSIAILLRMYCSGLFFILFGREVGLSSTKCLFGSLCYAFSGWIIGTGLVQAHFLINTVIFPLLILGIEKIYKKKSPVLFVLIVAYYLIRVAYFAYMAAIVAVIYILLRYFAYADRVVLKVYAIKIGTFILYGLLGIMISMVALMPTVLVLTGASTEASSESNSVFYSAQYYYNVMTQLLSGIFNGGGNYAYLGIPAFLLMLIPVALRNLSLKKTPAIMVLICFVMYMLAFFGSMFNGFSYATGRWSFMFVFFIAWCAVEVFDLKAIQERKNILLMFGAWGVMLFCTCGFQALGLVDLRLRIIAFVLMNLMGSLVAFGVLVVRIKHDKAERFKEIAAIGCVLAAVVFAWDLFFVGNINAFLKNGEINSQLEKSTQRVGEMIEDEGFYRIDQVDGICVNKSFSKPANENRWWQTRGLYTYDSSIPTSLLEFNKLVGNNSGYSERVFVFSNDNRMGLDFLSGVKYFLGNDIHNTDETSQYAGYGFTYSETIDGVEILENKYDAGLGFAYDQYIKQSEYEKLSRLEREQALLQGAVVSDEDAQIISYISELKADDIRTDIKDISFAVIGTDGAEVKENQIVAHKDGASFEIAVNDVSDSQLVISFDNLKRRSSGNAEGSPFTLSCENERVSKKAVNKRGNQALMIEDYDINMGYYRHYDGIIRITMSGKGVYDFDRFYVSAMSAELYDECAANLVEQKYEVNAFGDDFITGTVNTDKKGILYFSILNNGNWDVYVDGNKAEKLTSVNVAFSGVAIDEGQHEVQLKYNDNTRKLGALISLTGLVVLIVILIVMWYNKRHFFV